jgi:hypothetical protein
MRVLSLSWEQMWIRRRGEQQPLEVPVSSSIYEGGESAMKVSWLKGEPLLSAGRVELRTPDGRRPVMLERPGVE